MRMGLGLDRICVSRPRRNGNQSVSQDADAGGEAIQMPAPGFHRPETGTWRLPEAGLDEGKGWEAPEKSGLRMHGLGVHALNGRSRHLSSWTVKGDD